MIITFLGTGTSQGVPIISCKCTVCTSLDRKDKRLRSSIMVSYNDGTNIVVDTGPDFRYQMLREQVEHCTALLYTHGHKDHVAGLDDVRAFNHTQQMDMPVYADRLTIESIKDQFSYIFNNPTYPGIPKIDIHTISKDNPIEINGHNIIPIEVMHYKLPVLGFRFGDFTYITDANFISDSELEKIKGSKYLVLNALREEKHISHFTLEEAIEVALKTGVPNVYFTHISHQLGLHEYVSQHKLPNGFNLAYDGLKIEL